MSAIHLAFIRAQPGRSEQLGACLLSLLEPSRGQVGCLGFEICPVAGDPLLWRLQGSWRSLADMHAYFAAPLLQRVLAQALREGLLGSLDCNPDTSMRAA